MAKRDQSASIVHRLGWKLFPILGSLSLNRSLLLVEDCSSLGTKAGKVSEYRDNQSSISLKSIDYSTSKIEMNKSPDMRYVYATESAEFTILARRLDRKRDEWQRWPSCQELEANLRKKYSVCCPKRDLLFVFCCLE